MPAAQKNRGFKAYLAGPEVFLPNAIEIGRNKKSLCRLYGFEGLFPFDNEVDPSGHEARIDHLIYQANVAMMEEADFIVVNLTPFRGPSADVGSVFELGLMTGMRKPAFGYTNVKEKIEERLIREKLALPGQPHGQVKDIHGMAVENFGNCDNLMIDACLELQGNKIVALEASTKNIFEDLSGFETCLKMAHQHFAAPASQKQFAARTSTPDRVRFG